MVEAEGRPAYQFEHLPSVFFRVVLVWAAQGGEVYQKLCCNVVREVCMYYGRTPELFCILRRRLCRFSPSQKSWQPLCLLTCMRGNGALLGFACMGDALLLSLRNSTSASDFPYFATFREGKIQKLQYPRRTFYAALIYDESREVVYMFGAQQNNLVSTLSTAKCAKFLSTSDKVQPLCDMPRPRNRFGCCWHYGKVYLCGGTHASVDVFDPEAEAFSLHSRFDPDIDAESYFVAASHAGELVLFSNSFKWRLSDGGWTKERRQCEAGSYFKSRSCIVYSGVAYYGELMRCTGVDLATGEEGKYVACRPGLEDFQIFEE